MPQNHDDKAQEDFGAFGAAAEARWQQAMNPDEAEQGAGSRIRGLIGQLGRAYDTMQTHNTMRMNEDQLKANFGHRPIDAPSGGSRANWDLKPDLMDQRNNAIFGENPQTPRETTPNPLRYGRHNPYY